MLTAVHHPATYLVTTALATLLYFKYPYLFPYMTRVIQFGVSTGYTLIRNLVLKWLHRTPTQVVGTVRIEDARWGSVAYEWGGKTYRFPVRLARAPPSTKHFQITREIGDLETIEEDITERYLEFAGPQRDFYGLPMTPAMMGCGRRPIQMRSGTVAATIGADRVFIRNGVLEKL